MCAARRRAKKLEKRGVDGRAYLRGLSIEDAGRAALYLSGTAFAETDRRKLNAGGALLSKALAARGRGDAGGYVGGVSAAWGHGARRRRICWRRMDGRPQESSRWRLSRRCWTRLRRHGAGRRMPLVSALLEAARPIEAKYLLKLMCWATCARA